MVQPGDEIEGSATSKNTTTTSGGATAAGAMDAGSVGGGAAGDAATDDAAAASDRAAELAVGDAATGAAAAAATGLAAGPAAGAAAAGASDLATESPTTDTTAINRLSTVDSPKASVGNDGAASVSAVAPDPSRRYIRPTRSTNVFNNCVALLTRCGISILGSRVLYVRGRKSGEWRSVPVNLLTIDGERYLVSPRGHSQWVRNIRVTGYGELHVGRRVEKFVPHELADDDKPAILRAYLRRWKFEVGMFFDGVDATASDEVLRDIAPGYPVFRITTAQ